MKLASLLLCISPIIGHSVSAAYLEEIVVTGTRTEKLVRTNPYSISRLSEAELRKTFSDQTADMLQRLPGIQVSDAGQAGQKRVRIRGEEARRIALLIDGQEFMDHREVGVPLLVTTAGIDHIEVVRGPASVLYGGKAMGGVINVVTRRAYNEPFSMSAQLGYNTATNGTQLGASGGGKAGDFGWRFAYSEAEAETRKTPAGKIENTAYANDGGLLGVSWQLSGHELDIQYDVYNAESDVYVEPEVRFSPPFLDFVIDIPRRDRDKVRADYIYTPHDSIVSKVKLDYYRQSSQREFNTFPTMAITPSVTIASQILTTSELISEGLNFQADVSLTDHVVTGGFQIVGDELWQNRFRQSSTNAIVTSDDSIDEAVNLKTAAIYLQDDWSVTDQFSVLMGGRHYRVDGKLSTSERIAARPDFADNQSIFSLAAVWEYSEDTVFRAAASQGYLFPSLLNLAMGAYAGSSYVNPDPQLKPEKSLTLEVGIRNSGSYHSLELTVFQSSARDFIDFGNCQPTDLCLTTRDKIYRNVGSADSFGLELQSEVQFQAVSLDASLTWLRRKKAYDGVATYHSGLPKFSGSVALQYPVAVFDKPAELSIVGRFETSSEEVETLRSGLRSVYEPGYFVLNVESHFELSDSLRLGVQLGNLLNKQYSSAAENLLASRRHVVAKISYDLN